MAYLQIHCDYCGGKWDVYKRDIKNERARQCPHCFQEIDRQSWEKEVIPAFGMVEDANAELYKDHCDRKPLFYFDVVANLIFTNGNGVN